MERHQALLLKSPQAPLNAERKPRHRKAVSNYVSRPIAFRNRTCSKSGFLVSILYLISQLFQTNLNPPFKKGFP